MFREGQEPIFEPESVPPVFEEIVEAETKEPERETMFRGQEAEVTVERNMPDNSKKPEGGWIVLGAGKTPGTTRVKHFDKELYKEIAFEKLVALQPFKVGEVVPVIRGKNTLDAEGWQIIQKSGYGGYLLEKTIDGKAQQRMATKADLIDAQKMQLFSEISAIETQKEGITAWNDATVEDQNELQRLDNQIKEKRSLIDYWARKKQVCLELKRQEESARKLTEEKLSEGETEGDIIGQTPEGF